MRLPDFLIIGAAKAGTTSLYDLLARHPGTALPRQKEPEFLARDDLYAGGIESWAALFAEAPADRITGEGSTLYSLAPFFPQAAARARAHVPQARIIYMLREPVERAYSFYLQLVKNRQNATGDHRVHRSFEEFVLPERHARAAPRDLAFAPFNAHFPDDPELCLAGSDYPLQIRTWAAHFPPEQMLFLRFEDFVRDRMAVLAQVTDFLGLPPMPEAAGAGGGARNISREHFDRRAGRIALEGLRDRAGPVWGLRRLLPEGLRARLRARVQAGGAGASAHLPAPMEPATRARLAARFAPQIAETEALTGLDLSVWRQQSDQAAG